MRFAGYWKANLRVGEPPGNRRKSMRDEEGDAEMAFESPSSAQAVVAVTNLSRRFGSKAALDGVSLVVPRGSVFGLVGENGAGKSTLIKHILGLWRAQTGRVRVFDMDPVSRPADVLRRIGYLSEQPDLPEWMRVDEFLRYTAAFYPAWD